MSLAPVAKEKQGPTLLPQQLFSGIALSKGCEWEVETLYKSYKKEFGNIPYKAHSQAVVAYRLHPARIVNLNWRPD